jgi:hypothetical protein
MSTDTPAALANSPAEDLTDNPAEDQPVISEWAETALTVLFTAVAVLFLSFIAVVTGLV